MACGGLQSVSLTTEEEGELRGQRGRGATAVQSLLAIMMTANEGMGG